MSSPEELARKKIVHHLQRSQREAGRHRREARRVDARERVDQSAQLDRVSRVCISTIQRLYSMLHSFLFWDRNTDAARRDQREETGRGCARSTKDAEWSHVVNACGPLLGDAVLRN